MARIRSLSRASGSGKIHPTETDAEWSIVIGANGSRLLQIATFGSDQRASKPKVSQTIQIDSALAGVLRTALDGTFGPPQGAC